MNFKKVLEILLGEFKKREIDFALTGGLALAAVNVFRATIDIDMVVLLKQSDAVDEILKRYGYSAIYKTENVANYVSDLKEFGRIDVLFAHRKYLTDILDNAVYHDIFGAQVKVVRPEGLIGLKVQSSSNDPDRYHKDMSDIEDIIRKNRKTMDLELVREYFNLFDREKELDEILKRIK